MESTAERTTARQIEVGRVLSETFSTYRSNAGLLLGTGLILITIWAVTAPAIVVERVGPIAAFGRSRELVRGNGWAVFGVIVIVFLIGLGVGLAAFAIGSLGDDAGQAILSAAANIVVAPIVALASSILYFDLGGGPPVAEPDEAPDATEAPEAPTA